MSKREETSAQDESKAILRRLEGQSEKILGAAPENNAHRDDPAERWGKRLGLIIGYGLALYLLWHLFGTYVLK